MATAPTLSFQSESDLDFEAENLVFWSDNISNSNTVPYANPLLKVGNRSTIELQCDEKAAILRINMLGVGKKGVKVWFENGDLKIEGVEICAEDGSDEMEKKEGKYAVTFHEISDPGLVKKYEARAEMKNGILKIMIPKVKFEERKDVVHINVA